MDVDISEFLWETCAERKKLNVKAVHAVVAEVRVLEYVTVYHQGTRVISPPVTTVTGSVSEFHIDTPLSCINDIDVMFYSTNKILIPQGNCIPTHLPSEFDDVVTVWEIVDSGHAGYAYIDGRCVLRREFAGGEHYNEDETSTRPRQCKYKIVDVHRGRLTFCMDDKDKTTGPAMIGLFDVEGSSFRSYCGQSVKSDYVPCHRCLSWPLHATDWPRRHRLYGWPDAATIERVVNSGCDVVRVPHRHNNDDKSEHRLSFSRAETVLLNCCTKSQQIVYHILRYVVKTEGLLDIRDSHGHRIVFGYHVKTLLLWACELKPQKLWEDHRKLLRICGALLRTLITWLCKGDVQQYFVKGWRLPPEGNEVKSVQMLTIVSRLQSVVDNLPRWFDENYVCRYFLVDHINPLNPNELRVTHEWNASAADELRNAMRKIIQSRRSYGKKKITTYDEHIAITSTIRNSFSACMTVHSCLLFIRRLAEIDKTLLFFFYAVLFVNLAQRFKDEITTENSDLYNLYAALLNYCCVNKCAVDPRSIQNRSVSEMFHKATVLMSANEPTSSVAKIRVEMAKAFLHRVLEDDDSDVNASKLRCLSHVYLAALYYVTGHHRTAIDHCNMVTADVDHSHCTRSHVIEGSLLPHIDDDIDNVCGLVVLYEFIKAPALNQQQTRRHSPAFTTELFACYLQLAALSAEDKQPSKLTQQTLYNYNELFISDSQTVEPFIADVLLYRLCICKHANMPKKIADKRYTREILRGTCLPFSSADLCAALRQSAVDSVKEFRRFELLEYGVDDRLNEADFDAIGCLFRGDYERCLTLCSRELNSFQQCIVTTEIIVSSRHLLLLDYDLSFMFGLSKLCRYTSFQEDDRVNGTRLPSTLLRHTLLLYLYAESQMKLKLCRSSFVETLNALKVYQEHLDNVLFNHRSHDGIVLKFIYHKIRRHINSGIGIVSVPSPQLNNISINNFKCVMLNIGNFQWTVKNHHGFTS